MSEKTILLIDDDELVLKLLDINFRPRGFNVVDFLGGDGAFDKACEVMPSLVILDLMMPLVDGWSVLKQLKEDQRTNDIPVIVLTVKGSPEDIQRATDMGATQYVVKPFNPSELVSLVESIIGVP
ncbi:MAG: response regulator [Actinomycetota bacterium]|nr:response regulator [Actinomycetota bacterium]